MTTAMAPADIEMHLGQLQPELEYILSDAGVHKDVQAKIVSTGFGECRLFAKLDCGEGEKGARTYAKDDLEIDVTRGALQRSATARLVIAWETAKKRVSAKQENDAIQRTEDGPKTILKNEYVNLCRTLRTSMAVGSCPRSLSRDRDIWRPFWIN
jgi:hypothetical protein